jgi:4-amino-4-deoxy-L-arabinose transferase-like glycosyltransferase
VLIALFAGGIALRLWLMIEWRPGFLGFPDTYGYVSNSVPEGYFVDGLRPIGYPLFLAAARELSSDLSVTVLLQHVLGLGAGACVYGAGRAFGLGRRAALLPAAVMLLHGSAVWLEHGVLTEGPFSFFVCAALVPVALASQPERGPRSRAGLAALAGVLGAVAIGIRPVFLPCLAILVAWAAWALPGELRQRLVAAGALALSGGAIVFGNLAWAHDETGRWSFARHEYTALYGRVAQFADCEEFDPPPRTERLCPTTPREWRWGPRAYVFSPRSPLVRALGNPAAETAPPDAHTRANAFSRAAILHQPLDYLRVVGRDLVRMVDPDFPLNPNPAVTNKGSGGQPGRYLHNLPGVTTPDAERANVGIVSRLYSTDGIKRGDVDAFRSYERATRLNGVPWLIMLLLALSAPLLLRARERRAALLLAAYALVLTVFPVLFHSYDWRFQVVALGPLAMAAAFGAQGLAARAAARRQVPQG